MFGATGGGTDGGGTFSFGNIVDSRVKRAACSLSEISIKVLSSTRQRKKFMCLCVHVCLAERENLNYRCLKN